MRRNGKKATDTAKTIKKIHDDEIIQTQPHLLKWNHTIEDMESEGVRYMELTKKAFDQIVQTASDGLMTFDSVFGVLA